MSTATAEKNTAERAVYDSLPTAAEGWATPKAVAEVTDLAVSTVRKQLARLAEAGRVESSSDPEVTGAKGTLWRQTATGEPEPDLEDVEDVAHGGSPRESTDPEQVPVEAFEPPIGGGVEPAQEPADEPEPAEVDDTTGEPETAAGEPPDTPEPPSWLWPQAVADEDRLDQVEARALTERIKTSVRELLPLIIEAYRRRAHLALGYASWTEYCDAELVGLRMPIGDRQSAARALRQVGMSTRAIAGALGTSDATVRRDLGDAPATDDAPAVPVRGLDGKEYAAKPKPKTKREPVPAPPREVPVRVVEDPPVETGTCAYCGWSIIRRLDVGGAQWTHKASGDVECGKGHPGQHADPVVVIDGEAVDHGTVEAEAEPQPAAELGDEFRNVPGADEFADVPGGAAPQTHTLADAGHPGSGGLAVLRELLDDESMEFLLDHSPAAVAAAMEDLSDDEFSTVVARIDQATEWLSDVRSLSQLAK